MLSNYDDTAYHTLISLPNKCNEKCDIPIRFCTLKEIFMLHFGQEEYSVFMDHANKFNERARHSIGFNTVLLPTEEAIEQFKVKVSNMLKMYPYKSLVPENIDVRQVDILYHNFIDREMFKAMISDKSFADSFISSEWQYQINQVTNSLDQTGIVIGYLKSVEQLLATIVDLYKDKGKSIKTRDNRIVNYTSGNEDQFDKTLWSLQAFFEHNSGILSVTYFMKRHLIETIDSLREKHRNNYSHKNNLHDMSKILEIRELTIYLYFLILGGCIIDDEKLGFLGIYTSTQKEPNNRT